MLGREPRVPPVPLPSPLREAALWTALRAAQRCQAPAERRGAADLPRRSDTRRDDPCSLQGACLGLRTPLAATPACALWPSTRTRTGSPGGQGEDFKSESVASRNPWGWPPRWVSPAFFWGLSPYRIQYSISKPLPRPVPLISKLS